MLSVEIPSIMLKCLTPPRAPGVHCLIISNRYVIRCAAVAIGSRVYVVGGRDRSNSLNSAEVFDHHEHLECSA